MRRCSARREVLLASIVAMWLLQSVPGAQVLFGDETDRAAFRAWFVLLADSQFYRPTPDVGDCAALVRHAVREALRPHTADWVRRVGLPAPPLAPDVRSRPAQRDGALPLFLVRSRPSPRYAEFADARTIVTLNARLVSRRPEGARPGDLLYFRRGSERLPDHLMVFVGRSVFEPEGDDWVVYHTGPAGAADSFAPHDRPMAGEVRKARLADLRRHPARAWRPVPENPVFAGVYRLSMM